MAIDLKTSNASRQRAAKRTAWILAAVAATFFVLSIIEQIAITHQH